MEREKLRKFNIFSIFIFYMLSDIYNFPHLIYVTFGLQSTFVCVCENFNVTCQHNSVVNVARICSSHTQTHKQKNLYKKGL